MAMSPTRPERGQRALRPESLALARRLRASKAGAASWACDCGSEGGVHAPDCRKERRRLDARKGGQRTFERYGASHYRRLRWRQVMSTRNA
jgi:hypothetical protein